jgi:serine/threonine protein kinase
MLSIENKPASKLISEVRGIIKELKDFEHIIRFFGVAEEDSKYYLMEHGNLHEYYTRFKGDINLEIKIKFALNICCGISYLHDCQVNNIL